MKADDLGLDCGQTTVVIVISVSISTLLNLLVNMLLVEYTASYTAIPLIVNSTCAVTFAGMAIGFSFLIRHAYSDSLQKAYLDAKYVSEAKTAGLLVSTIFTALALSAISHFVSGNVYSWGAISNIQLLPVVVSQLIIVVALMVTYFVYFSSNALVTFARKLNEGETQPLQENGEEEDGEDIMNTATKLSTPTAWF